MRFHIPNTSGQVLFETTLEPTVPSLNKLAKELNAGEGEIGSVRGKKARVSVGVPYYENLISRLKAEKEEVPHDIRMMLPKYDFHFVSLSCSFLPDNKCKFVWARFGVELSARSKSGELLAEKPIAYDIFPNEVTSEIKCARETKLGAGLKFNFGIEQIDPISGDVTRKEEFLVYEPELFSFGIGRSIVAWNFSKTKEKSIFGDKRDLLLIVRASKDSRITGKFLLAAEVEFNIGKLIRIPFVRKGAVEVEYKLSE